jgi:DNA-binding NtrC family response regulator
MSPATQAKALRLLQEQQFERIGGNSTVKTDVRIIAATNRDLNKAVAEGRFRQDLLYRLNGFTIQLPPLRDRPEDVPALTEHFVKFFNRELGKKVRTIAPAVVDVLQQHRWPGNVREFQSAIRYAMVHSTGDVLLPECLPESCFPKSISASRALADSAAVHLDVGPVIATPTEPTFPFVKLCEYVRRLLAEAKPDIYRSIVQEVDRHMLHEVMKHFHGNQLQAAERLGISRMTLRSKLRSLGMIQDRNHDPSSPS